MVVLLNLIPLLILLGGTFLWFKVKEPWVIGLVALLFVIYFAVQPSYLPKGTISRSEIPEHVESNMAVEDRQSKPLDPKSREVRNDGLIEKGLPWSPANKQTN